MSPDVQRGVLHKPETPVNGRESHGIERFSSEFTVWPSTCMSVLTNASFTHTTSLNFSVYYHI